MDISFMTSAGDGAWSLEECARWAADHDFDCVRLADRGVLDSERILTEGPDEVKETLAAHDLYLACVTAHCNLLDDEEEVRMAEQARLIRAIESARALDCPVVITGSGAPVRNGQFYGMFSSNPGNPTDRCDELVERFREMFTPVVKVAEEKDIKIALDVAVRMGNIGCNPEMWEKILDAVPSDHLGLSCDPSHWIWMMIMPAEDAIRDFAGKRYFADVKDAGNLLARAGFTIPVADQEAITVSYPDPFKLMADLRGMGEGNAVMEARKGLTSRTMMMEAARYYSEDFATDDERIPATFQVITLSAWAEDKNNDSV